MNIDEITAKRLGGFPQVGTAIADGFPIGQQPTKPCEHDFLYLRSEVPDETEVAHVDAYTDVFYCRRCLEYREVKRG